MKIACSLLFSALFTCIALGQSTASVSSGKDDRSKETCPWPANLDAVKAAPETHKVIFENEHVRVLEVTNAPHSKEPVHTHCWPSTLYIQQTGDIIVRDADGKVLFDARQLKENEKQKAPFVLWASSEGPHSDENRDDLPAKLIQIEDKGATNRSQETCPWPANLDGVKAAPETHKVIFENEHVRVLEVTIAPHSKEPIHAHCWPSTLYVQQGGDIIDRDANGKVLFDSRQLKVKPTFPFVQWTPPQAPHSVENLADVPMKLIRIENKD
jgi:mannose-6-phosphate isomerase-like protein (cupin superfamily)